MDRLEELRTARKSAVIVYDKFMKLYPKFPQRLYCFHEGKMDDKYYGLRIDKYFSNEKEYMCCDGKEKVLYMKEKIEQSPDYKGCRSLFFVDRDFDESICDDKIFETPCYSIENLFTQKYTLEQILKREFYVLEIDENFHVICKLFEQAKEKFHEVIKELNAWIYFQREQEKKYKEEKKLNLEQLTKLNLYSFTYDVRNGMITIVKKYNLNDLQNHFPDRYHLDESVLCQYTEMMESRNPDLDYRGKQEFEFFCVFWKR